MFLGPGDFSLSFFFQPSLLEKILSSTALTVVCCASRAPWNWREKDNKKNLGRLEVKTEDAWLLSH